MITLKNIFTRYPLIVICVILFGYVLTEQLANFYTFHRGFTDLYFYDHACWNISRGFGPWLDYFHKSFLADHFYAYLFLIAPFYWIIPTPVWIFIAHTMVLVLMAIPILRVAREQFGTRGIWITALLLLGSYTFRQVAQRDLCGDVLMAALLSWIVYGLIHERYRMVMLLCLVLPFTKETAGATLVMIGFYLLVFRRKWVEGLCIVAYGIGSMYVLIHLVIPYFNGGEYRHLARFSQFGATFGEQVHTILFHPRVPLAFFLRPNSLAYLAALLLPLLVLPLFSSYSVLSLGILVQNILATAYNDTTIDVGAYYSAGLIPIFGIATLIVLFRLKKNWAEQRYRKLVRWFTGVTIFFLVINVLVFVFMEVRYFWITPHVRAGHEALRLIPSDKSVSSSEAFFSHIHYRQQINFFPDIGNAGYIIIERRDLTVPDHIDKTTYIAKMWKAKQYRPVFHYLIFAQYGSDEPKYVETLASLKNDRNYKLIFDKQDVAVYKKLTPDPTLFDTHKKKGVR